MPILKLRVLIPPAPPINRGSDLYVVILQKYGLI